MAKSRDGKWDFDSMIEGFSRGALWINPDAKVFPVNGVHHRWVADNRHEIPKELHQHFEGEGKKIFDPAGTEQKMLDSGWVKKTSRNTYEGAERTAPLIRAHFTQDGSGLDKVIHFATDAAPARGRRVLHKDGTVKHEGESVADDLITSWLTEGRKRVIPGTVSPDHKAPGTRPIPHGHIRFFHITQPGHQDDDHPDVKLDSIAKNGIKLGAARGETYGEPNHVWAAAGSHKRFPGGSEHGHESDGHAYVEFSLHHDDPRLKGAIGEPWKHDKPDGWQDEHSRDYEARGTHVAFSHDILPSDIVAVHKSWHGSARKFMSDEEGTRRSVQNGEYDWLADRDDESHKSLHTWLRGTYR